MSAVSNDSKIWMNGKLVAKENANVSILTHTLHYGVGVFEGIRCYKNAGRLLWPAPTIPCL